MVLYNLRLVNVCWVTCPVLGCLLGHMPCSGMFAGSHALFWDAVQQISNFGSLQHVAMVTAAVPRRNPLIQPHNVHTTITGVARRHATITGVARRHATITGVARRHATITGVARRHATITGVARRHATITCVARRHANTHLPLRPSPEPRLSLT